MMTVEAFLKKKYGNIAVARLRNRNRGGANNAKGNVFEAEFAIHKIATLYTSGNGLEHTRIETQAEDFVDDLVCVNDSQGTKSNYQLKDSQTIRWGCGIADDFAIQQDLNTNFHGILDSKTVLVVSHASSQARLTKKMPKGIQNHATCVHFKNDAFNALLIENDPQIQPFRKLCAFPDDNDKVTTVWQALNGAWHKSKAAAATPFSVVNDAARGYKPYYFKLNSGAQVPHTLKILLDKISGLSYRVTNGFIEYEIKGCAEGSIEIGSDQMNELESKLSACNVGTWIEFIEAISRGDV